MIKLSESENICWNFIQENIDKIQYLTMREVGKQTYTSIATVGRTIKKMGYDSYFELKLESKNITKHCHEEHKVEEFSPEVTHIIEESKREFIETINQLSVDNVKRATNLLSKSQIISIFASNSSILVAKDAQKKLHLSGKQVNIYSDANSMDYYSRTIPRNSLVLCITLSGETPEILSALSVLKNRQLNIITLTGNQKSTLLSTFSDIIFIGFCFIRKEANLGLDVDSRLCLSLLIRILVDCLAIKKRLGNI